MLKSPRRMALTTVKSSRSCSRVDTPALSAGLLIRGSNLESWSEPGVRREPGADEAWRLGLGISWYASGMAEETDFLFLEPGFEALAEYWRGGGENARLAAEGDVILDAVDGALSALDRAMNSLLSLNRVTPKSLTLLSETTNKWRCYLEIYIKSPIHLLDFRYQICRSGFLTAKNTGRRCRN